MMDNVNLSTLSLARLFLFCCRDFWFEVPLPFYLRSLSCTGLSTDTCQYDLNCTRGVIRGLDNGICQKLNLGGGCGGLGKLQLSPITLPHLCTISRFCTFPTLIGISLFLHNPFILYSLTRSQQSSGQGIFWRIHYSLRTCSELDATACYHTTCTNVSISTSNSNNLYAFHLS